MKAGSLWLWFFRGTGAAPTGGGYQRPRRRATVSERHTELRPGQLGVRAAIEWTVTWPAVRLAAVAAVAAGWTLLVPQQVARDGQAHGFLGARAGVRVDRGLDDDEALLILLGDF